jgi:predicted GIY-YIG superfamily endonuclease
MDQLPLIKIISLLESVHNKILAHLAKGKGVFAITWHPSSIVFLPSFGSFGQAVSEEKILKNLYRDNCILNTDIYIQTRVIFL